MVNEKKNSDSRLDFDFIKLPRETRLRILFDLELIHWTGVRKNEEPAVFAKAFRIARTTGKLEALRAAIAAARINIADHDA